MELIKALDSLRSALQKAENGTGTTMLLSNLNVDGDYQAWCEAIPKLLFENSTNLKTLRKPLKVILINLHQSCPQSLEKFIQSNINEVFHGEPVDRQFPFSNVSFLMEDCPFCHPLLSFHYSALVERVCNAITAAICVPADTDKQVYLCDTLKVILQTLQFMKEDVLRCFRNPDDATFDRLIKVANSCIIMLAQSKIYNSTVRNLCGICLGHLLNYDGNDETVAHTVLNLCGQKLNSQQASGPFVLLGTDQISSENVAVYTIFLFKGVFSCTRSSAFVCDFGRENSLTLLHLSFPIILDALQVQCELQYHGFQVLKLWWTKIQYANKSSCTAIVTDVLNEKSDFVQKTLKILYQHWDSPISGVPIIVVDIFKILICSLKCTESALECEPKAVSFLEKMLEDLLKLSSAVKGKYNFISALVTELGADLILKRYSGFLHSLTALLGVNHLCPVISKTYKAIFTRAVMGSKSKENMWDKILLPHLVKALSDSNPSIRVNASIYWLPLHLKLITDGYIKLMQAVANADFDDRRCNGDNRLLALTSISKVARSESLIHILDVDLEVLQTALSSFNVSVRAEAFLLVCCNSKTSEQITKLEMDLVKTHLPLNMNSDSATFRQGFAFCMRSFAERIRDSVLSKKIKSVKDSASGENYIESCSEVFKVLLDNCTNSLHPSFSYQRKKTAIDIFSSLLSVLCQHLEVIFFAKILIEDGSRKLFIHLLNDSVPEIRNQSLSILTRYFPPVTEGFAENLKTSAYRLCASPRAHDGESGAVILQYLFITLSNAKYRGFRKTEELRKVLKRLEHDAIEMEKNILLASCQAPAHGWMLALMNCLSTLMPNETDKMELADVFKDIAKTTMTVIKFTLKSVFGCLIQNSNDESDMVASRHEIGVSADFSEMTERIKGLILDNQEEIETDEVLLTEKHEAILASSWLCLLRGGSLLNSIAVKKCSSLYDVNLLTEICDTFVLILTCCRHRGAIEGCFESFLSTCKALLSSKHQQLRSIPDFIIRTTCDSLKNQSQGSSNVTRRSAGIPLIVEAILVAELSCKRDEIFHEMMGKIIALSQQVDSLQLRENNEKFDFPQVHGLFILKHVFRSSQLGTHVLQYCVDALKIAIKSLSSPLWVARNAATHLFGAVVNRMLGQKVIDGTQYESLENSVSSAEFFSLYVGLEEIILEEMKLSVPLQGVQKCPLPKPGLHPVLSMLSKLTYGKHVAGNIPHGLVAVTKILLGSPVHSIRYLSAKSLLGLVDDNTGLSFAFDFIGGLLSDLSDLDSNTQHGYLVFIKMVSDTLTDGLTTRDLMFSKLQMFWSRNASLHPIVADLCLEIISSYAVLLKGNSSAILVIAQRRITRAAHLTVIQPGMDNYLFDLAKIVLTLSNGRDTFAVFEDYLWSGKASLQRACMSWLNNSSEDCFFKAIQRYLIKAKNSFGESANILCECIETYITVLDHLEKDFKINQELIHMSYAIISESSPLSLRCVGLLLLSTVLVDTSSLRHFNRDDNSTTSAVKEWVNILSNRTSATEASEPLRMSASRSLKIAGPIVYMKLVTGEVGDLGEFVCCALSLLHDEQPHIRKHACEFVTNLIGKEADVINIHHQNIATQGFLRLIFSEAACSVAAIQTIFHHCFKLSIEDCVIRNQAMLFDKEPFNMYAEPVEIARTVANTFLFSLAGKNVPDSFIAQNTFHAKESFRAADFKDGSKSRVSARLCHIIFLQMLLSHPKMERGLVDKGDLQSMLKSSLQRKDIDSMLTKEIHRALLLLENYKIPCAAQKDRRNHVVP